MSEWKELGFKAGLEIHHQINTEKKLFCKCPVQPYSDVWHAEMLRHMRPTMSELGEYDGTALMEFKTKKEIIYRLNRETVCTYEMDDDPPFPINQEAVDKALTIALAFQCKIVGELHVIRKQYLDGSIPAGFQRTTIVGVDGILTLASGKQVEIIQIGLEEDSCREVSDIGHRITYYTDRLSIPLIEVVTGPTLDTPEEAAEATERIGRLLRATGFARRGIGAVRQDVNLSIEGGTRVEIKGVPRIPRIPALLSYEAHRQAALLEIAAELKVRGFAEGDRPGELIKTNPKSVEFENPILRATQIAGDEIALVKLPQATGFLSKSLTQGHTFADEFAGRVRVVACLDSTPNLYHTDGASGGLNEVDRKTVIEEAGASEKDVVVVLFGNTRDITTAANEVLDRWAEAILGIPNETRQALADNTTDFERVLPGPDRMYPDTDSPPFEIVEKRIEKAAKYVPELPWDREERYRKLGIPEDIAVDLAIDPLAELLDKTIREEKLQPLRAGEVLSRFKKAERRKHPDLKQPSKEQWQQILDAMADKKVYREGVPTLIRQLCAQPEISLNNILEDESRIPLNNQTINSHITKEISDFDFTSAYHKNNIPTLIMCNIMKKVSGQIPGAEIWALVKEQVAMHD
ncbi:Glu-tRNA(Gln) amidotransferase subunit GatE [bacterium]|nr:Glu-tRNA(Gln) amidotransferase subunit GatE [bacterium]